MQWGRIPAQAATGLEARLLAKHYFDARILRAKNTPGRLALAPGQEVVLSSVGLVDGPMGSSDPRTDFPEVLNPIPGQEGIEGAKDVEPCEARANSKTGCAFAEVSKFNIAVDVVYFEDGTIWGNYGFGYALPTPDGIFQRVDARDFPGAAGPASRHD